MQESRVTKKAVAVLVVSLAAALAQEPRFSSTVQLVMIDVQAVEKGTGRILDLLGPNDFEVYAGGQRQVLREFHFETTPLDIIFLIYGRQGVGPVKDINAFRAGLRAAGDTLRAGDRAAIIRTENGSRVDLPLTDDLDKARHILLWGDPRYRTGYDHLYDAVSAAATLLPGRKDPDRRRTIVAITDDIDRGSRITTDALITELLERDATLNEAVVVFGATGRRVGIGGIWGIPRVERNVGGSRSGSSLLTAVDATGGEMVSGHEFQEELPELTKRLRMRYLLGFYAQPTVQREYHSVEVRLTSEAAARYPTALIRARKGFYTAPVSGDPSKN